MAKKPTMPPPGHRPGIMIAVGIGKRKKNGASGDPMDDDNDQAQEPDADADDAAGGGGDSGAAQGGDDDKMDPEKAIVIRADQHCRNCSNYEPLDGSCKEVSGTFDPDDACHAGFNAVQGDETQDSDDGSANEAMPPPGGDETAVGAGQ